MEIFGVIWLVGFIGMGLWQILSMSGKRDLGFDTTGVMYLLATLFISVLWFYFFPRWMFLRWSAQ